MKLSQNVYFQISWLGGLITALIVAGVIGCNNELRGCAQVECFSTFLDIFDLPIKILTAGLTLAGFVAILHKSEQTRKQIEISINQNIFKNFLDHRNEFIKVVELLETELLIFIKGKNILYHKFFPENNTQKVNFTSTGLSNEKSDLLFFIEEHNQLVEKYNELILDYSNDEKVPKKPFDVWLTSYLMLTRKIGISTENTKPIMSQSHIIFFNPKVITELPIEIEKFINTNVDALKEFSKFCFPNTSENIKVISAEKHKVAIELMGYYCGE